MRKINKPNGLIGVNGKKPIAIADILPYLPNKSGFIDTRHWVWGGGSSEILNTAIYEEEEILWSEPFKGQEGQDSKA